MSFDPAVDSKGEARPFHEAIGAADTEQLSELFAKLPTQSERSRVCELHDPCTLLAHAICKKQTDSHELVDVICREGGLEQLNVPMAPGNDWTAYTRAMAGDNFIL